MFAMLFTAGVSLFLYTFNLNHQYDQASQYSNQVQASKVGEVLTLRSAPVQGRETAGTVLSTSISNIGNNATTIVDFFVRNQTGTIVCNSGEAVIPSTPPCITQLRGSADVNVLPSNFSLGIGQTVNLTTSLSTASPGSFPSRDIYTCTVANVCSVNVVTALGNVFTGSYPLASPLGVIITTTLNATQISPKQHVFDTALLSGNSPTAGGTVTYTWYTDGDCGASGGTGTALPAVTVTNGVVPDSPVLEVTGQGQYSFKAVYSGDINNPSATSACEPLNVAQPGVCVPTPTTFCYATVSQGIGSIAFDFNSYKWYYYSPTTCDPAGSLDNGGNPNTNPTASCYLSPTSVDQAPVGYIISNAAWTTDGCASGGYCLFSVNITNADPLGRTLTLNSYTQLWFSNFNLKSGGGTAQSWAYGLINMSTHWDSALGLQVLNTPLQTTTNTPTITIPYAHTVTIFFGINKGGDPDQYSSYNISPMFILFSGTMTCQTGNSLCAPGVTNWGQDIPLATTLWTA